PNFAASLVRRRFILSDKPEKIFFPGMTAGFLGRMPFGEVWALQRKIWEDRASGRLAEDIFLFLEHGPVFTLGLGGSEGHVISRRSPVGDGEVPLFRINRGGEVTYHGPGQLMLYALCDLRARDRDVHSHCRRLEEVFLRYLVGLGFEAERRPEMPGLWVKGQKILSLGVGARRWVTMHGVAFNVTTDLRYFGMIHPCGEAGSRVTSLEQLLRRAVPLEEVTEALIPLCAEVFEQDISLAQDGERWFAQPAQTAEKTI
ncbi:lipoyl(octanoyl) transferase LipB, partial [Nitrospinota bacterium]